MRLRIWLALVCLFGFTAVSAQDYVDPAELADPNGQFVEVNGAQVYYVEEGPADGAAVLLLHGFLGSTVDWTNTIPALAEAGFRVVAFDRPPFGLSDKSTDLDYSPDAQGDLTVGLMDELGIEQAALVGHSAGAPVVLNVAQRYPERVSKVALVAGAVTLAEDMDEENSASGAFAFLTQLDPDSPLAQGLIRSFFTSDFASDMLNSVYYDPDNIPADRMELSTRGTRIEGWEGGLLAWSQAMTNATRGFEAETLAGLKMPVLILWGEEDQIVPITLGERLREIMPDADWIAYPETGHMTMDEGETFNADLIAFLGD